MCNIVILAGHKYLVDVGFGNNAPTFAVPLKEHYSNRNTGNNRGGSMVRMSRQYVSETGIQSKSSTEAMWIYSFKYDEHMPWIPGYCFSEIPFLLADYEVMNFYTSQHPDSWFRKNIVVSSVIFDEADRAIGDLTLFNGRVKERRNGQSRLLFESHGKSETAVALLKYFNIAV
jgi:arylamine N-acetyltransferase